MDDCTFDWIQGSALRVSAATKCSFRNVKVKRCGASDMYGYDPAVYLPGTEEGAAAAEIVQGSVFQGFKVEVCEHVPYVHIGQGSKVNKFDDFGFEADPDFVETIQTFLLVRGEYQQLGKLHFNCLAFLDGNVPKCVIDGPGCQLDELMFRGLSGMGGSLRLTHNAVGCLLNAVTLVVELKTQHAGPFLSPAGRVAQMSAYPQIRIEGSRNQIGRITCLPTDDNSQYGWLHVSGERNQIGEVIDKALLGVVLDGDRNKLLSLVSTGRPYTALRVRGTRCDVLQADIEDCLVANEPVVEVGSASNVGIPGDDAEERTANGSRVRVRVVEAVDASEGILVSGEDIQLLPGTAVQQVTNGHGIRWTGAGGGFSDVDVFDIGLNGYFIDGGSPVIMTGWVARRCGTRELSTTTGILPFGGFYARAFSPISVRAMCTDFVVHEDGGNHSFSFRIEAIGGTTPSYENWTIRGNVADGGSVSIPTSGSYSADFDSQGLGPDITSAATVSLGDSAGFFTVKGNTNITSITASWPGREATLRFDPSGGFSVIKGSNLKLNSDFAVGVGAYDALTLICDGTNWIEVCRSNN